MNNLKEKFFAFLNEINISESYPKVAVAVSGGADSLIMTICLNDWIKSRNGILYSITIDHQLREGSGKEALLVNKWMNSLGINNQIINIEVNKSNNLSKQARDLRYDALINYCNANGIYELFVGHNLDDKAENFLIRAFRGSGIEGLAAIKSIFYKNGVRIIRPLLNISRNEIEFFLKSFDQEWIEDPSNLNNKFLRSRIRLFINSQNFLDKELLKKRLSENSEKLSMVRDVINNRIFDFISKNVQVINDEEKIFLNISLNNFLFLERYLATKFLQMMLVILGNNEYSPRSKGINRLYEFLCKDSSSGVILIANCKITKNNKKFFLINNNDIDNVKAR